MSEKGLKGSMEKAKKLCMENYYIMQENEKLREMAKMLKEENEALLAEIKKREQQQMKQQANAVAPNPNYNTRASTLPDLSGAQEKPKNGATSS